MPQLLVWQRRQTPPQQTTIGPVLMEGVEKTNTVVVRRLEQDIRASRRNPYAIEVDQGRNYYVCGRFGHMAHHYRNRGRGKAIEGRRVEYGGRRIEEIHVYANNLKGVENLEFLD